MQSSQGIASPPIVELVLGVQFSPLTKLTSGHFGLFWSRLGVDEWVEARDAVPIEDRFELFEQSGERTAPSVRLEPIRLPGRFIITNRQKDRLLQIQATRFHLNWRKANGRYPRYKELIKDFEQKFGEFREFAGEFGLAEFRLNQWELTYVDAFPKGDYWETPADWGEFLPGLFGSSFSVNPNQLILERRSVQVSYEIAKSQGRLHVSANLGLFEETPSLLMQMTARGPLSDAAEDLRSRLDLGHKVAVEAFYQIVSEKVKSRCEVTP